MALRKTVPGAPPFQVRRHPSGWKYAVKSRRNPLRLPAGSQQANAVTSSSNSVSTEQHIGNKSPARPNEVNKFTGDEIAASASQVEKVTGDEAATSSSQLEQIVDDEASISTSAASAVINVNAQTPQDKATPVAIDSDYIPYPSNTAGQVVDKDSLARVMPGYASVPSEEEQSMQIEHSEWDSEANEAEGNGVWWDTSARHSQLSHNITYGIESSTQFHLARPFTGVDSVPVAKRRKLSRTVSARTNTDDDGGSDVEITGVRAVKLPFRRLQRMPITAPPILGHSVPRALPTARAASVPSTHVTLAQFLHKSTRFARYEDVAEGTGPPPILSSLPLVQDVPWDLIGGSAGHVIPMRGMPDTRYSGHPFRPWALLSDRSRTPGGPTPFETDEDVLTSIGDARRHREGFGATGGPSQNMHRPVNPRERAFRSGSKRVRVSDNAHRQYNFQSRYVFDGYPDEDTAVPEEYTMYDICQKHPNSIRGEGLLPFVQAEWSGNEIFNCLKPDAQAWLRGTGGGDPTMVYQKRLERMRKDLRSAGEYGSLLAESDRLREDGRPAGVRRGSKTKKAHRKNRQV